MFEYNLFNQLPAWSQINVLNKKGTVVAQRQHKEYTITLYYLNNYFVELWEKQNLEIIGAFHKSVSPLAILEPYTDTIHLPQVFNS
jgi:hypothetical protein